MIQVLKFIAFVKNLNEIKTQGCDFFSCSFIFRVFLSSFFFFSLKPHFFFFFFLSFFSLFCVFHFVNSSFSHSHLYFDLFCFFPLLSLSVFSSLIVKIVGPHTCDSLHYYHRHHQHYTEVTISSRPLDTTITILVFTSTLPRRFHHNSPSPL